MNVRKTAAGHKRLSFPPPGADSTRSAGAIALLLFFLGGCVPGRVSDPVPDARLLIRQGQEEKARQVLKAGTKAGTPVSDEALFRLALLLLRRETEEGEGEAIQVLERLRREHPKSEWWAQAAPLLDFLQKNRNQRKSLREQNATLAKENRDLRKTIEKVKALELQLEQRRR